MSALVARGYGPGGSVQLVVTRGYGGADPYAAQGWATRDFYSPYWMGMVDPTEITQRAIERARDTRLEYGNVPPEAEQVIRSLADDDGDEIERFVRLHEAITAARLDWQDHYGGHLKAIRDELHEARKAKAAAELELAQARKHERAEIVRQARLEIARREIARLEERRKRNMTITLLLSTV